MNDRSTKKKIVSYISKYIDSAIISKPTQGNLISDHYVISVDILVSPFIFSNHVKHYRNISKINPQFFINSVYAYISIHNTSLANYIFYDNFNDALRYSLGAHSPLIYSPILINFISMELLPKKLLN